MRFKSMVGAELRSVALGASLIAMLMAAFGQAVAGANEQLDPAIARATPTHHQTGLIKANADGLPQRNLKCFCLTPDNRIVAGMTGGAGELRLFNDAGDYLESWPAPFEPDAMFVRADGRIFLAGEGQLARLSASGDVERQQKAPHADAMSQNPEQVRADVIAQNKRRAEVYVEQAGQYDQMLQRADEQIEQVKEQIAALDVEAEEAREAADESDRADSPADRQSAIRKQMLERQLAMHERMKSQYQQVKTQWDEMIARNKPKELTEEEIDKMVKESIKYRMQASSISATNEEVFLATRAVAGHGFDVWKMDTDFAGGREIITGLSGCCGQMDVKANENGLFVAENSKHHVCRYDRDGELICQWGHGARKGLEGFGSCCNPMNVAFGPSGVVYTAEDNTGRIKRYSPDGELLGLVGASELVPGCKNVSIAVNSDGSRVYMLDITRGHIVRMEPYKPGEAPAPAEVEEEPIENAGLFDTQPGEAPNAGEALAKGLLKILGFGD